jgi:hypothetical protein
MPLDGTGYETTKEYIVLDWLTRARELIAKGWCKGVAARNARGKPIELIHSSATKFCAMGALYRVTGFDPKEGSVENNECWVLAISSLGYKHTSQLTTFNDASPSRVRVLAMFDRAIKKTSSALSP